MVKLGKLKTRCFFDVSIYEENIGRIIFELFNDVCPKTCENFKALCTGEKGLGKLTGKPLHYKGVAFHRIVKNFIIQSGDFSQGNGKGGESIYGGTFEDESFHYKHEKPYLLSMANRGKNTNGSQFFITLAPSPHLDGVHVVFGHVISGQDVIEKIANQAVDKNSKPLVSVRISNCGELIPQIKQKENEDKKRKSHKSNSDSESGSESDDSDDDSESDSDDGDSDSDNEKHKKDSDKKVDDSNSNDKESSPKKEDDLVSHFFAPKHNVKINADEIPEVPSNRFLSRGFKPKENDGDNKGDRSRSDRMDGGGRHSSRRFFYSKSGRKIKGRGLIRYRTPSPNERRFRRSETPPHWKSEQSKLKSFSEIINEVKNGKKSDDAEEWSNRNDNSMQEKKRRRFHEDRERNRHSHNSTRRHSRNDRRDRSPVSRSSQKSRSRERSPYRPKNISDVQSKEKQKDTQESTVNKSHRKDEDKTSKPEKENRNKRPFSNRDQNGNKEKVH